METRTIPPSEAVPLSLEALYAAYGDMIYRLALQRTRNRADAEDVLQDVFFAACAVRRNLKAGSIKRRGSSGRH